MSLDAGLTAAGLVLGLAGGITETIAKQQAFEATAKASIAGENIREQQMMFEGDRRKRVAVREAIMAAAINKSQATNQGAGYGSGAAGGVASATQQGRENAQTVVAAGVLGRREFRANKAWHLANANAQMWSSVGQGISGLGGGILNSSDAIGRLFGQA
jgi:hypothetical protein